MSRIRENRTKRLWVLRKANGMVDETHSSFFLITDYLYDENTPCTDPEQRGQWPRG